MSGSGSLLDSFCSRCHMQANYVDNIPLGNVTIDSPSGVEHGLVNPTFDPTADNGTGLAFATVAGQFRNTSPGQRGVFCESCHTYVKRGTRLTTTTQVRARIRAGADERDPLSGVTIADQDQMSVADAASTTLGYGIGAGSFRLSPHAIGSPERFGPLSWNDYTATLDPYVSDVFNVSFTTSRASSPESTTASGM